MAMELYVPARGGPGFSYWFDQVFIPSYNVGDRDVITVRDKRYGTLLGFALLKVGG